MKVSVIIPVYNTADYVGRCIDSLLSQTHKSLEIIIVDDGSIDSSLEICSNFRLKDDRIIIISQNNSGASVARNKGLDRATGEYVMFVDSDDWIESCMVEVLLRAMLENRSDVVISQVPGDRHVLTSDTALSSKATLIHLVRDNVWWSPYGKMFQRSLFDEIRFPQPTIAEDYWLMAHLLLRGSTVFFIPQEFYHRTSRQGSLSHLPLCERKFDEIDNVMDVLAAVKKQYPEIAPYAERNLAGTLLKLLLLINATPDTSRSFASQQERVLSLIRSHYWSMLTNHAIPIKQKLLLAGCFSRFTASQTSKFYKYVSRA